MLFLAKEKDIHLEIKNDFHDPYHSIQQKYSSISSNGISTHYTIMQLDHKRRTKSNSYSLWHFYAS